MAILIFRFPIVAQLAYALDDVELACSLAEENAGGLPGLGEDVGRSNLELDVQDVLFGKVDAFGDTHVAVVRHADRLADRERGLRQDVDGVDDKRVALPTA